MAKCKFGAIITDMRGKLGGHVLQGNGFANTIRTGYSGKGGIDKIAPIFKKTVKKINKNWSMLSQTEKNEWHDVATRLPIKDILGDQLFLSGQNLHRRNYTAFYATHQMGVINPANLLNSVPSDGLHTMTFDLALGTLTMASIDMRMSAAYMFYAKLVDKVTVKIEPKTLKFFSGVHEHFPDSTALYNEFILFFPHYLPGQSVQFGISQVNNDGFKSFVKTVYATYVV